MPGTIVTTLVFLAAVIGALALIYSPPASPASVLIEKLGVPTSTPGTLVKNEQMAVDISVLVVEPRSEKPRLQLFDTSHDQNGKWVNIGPLDSAEVEPVSKGRVYSDTFWFLDTGTTTYIGKRGSSPTNALPSANSRARLRVYAGSDDDEVAFVSSEFSLGFLDANLPPDPGEAGKATLNGIDVDGDGIRDDVQRYIVLTYPDSSQKRMAAMQSARAALSALNNSLSRDDAAQVFLSKERAAACMWYVFEDLQAAQASRQRLSEVIENTSTRVAAKHAFNDVLGPAAFFDTPYDQRSAVCDENPNNLPN